VGWHCARAATRDLLWWTLAAALPQQGACHKNKGERARACHRCTDLSNRKVAWRILSTQRTNQNALSLMCTVCVYVTVTINPGHLAKELTLRSLLGAKLPHGTSPSNCHEWHGTTSAAQNARTFWSVERVRVRSPWIPSSHLAATHSDPLQSCHYPSIQASTRAGSESTILDLNMEEIPPGS
jgi:hypothetical protein